MVKRVVFFVFGFLFGVAFDMVPHAIETIANTNVCRESCSGLLTGASITIYVIMPIAWGCIFTAVIGKPHQKRILLASALFSITLMALLCVIACTSTTNCIKSESASCNGLSMIADVDIPPLSVACLEAFIVLGTAPAKTGYVSGDGESLRCCYGSFADLDTPFGRSSP